MRATSLSIRWTDCDSNQAPPLILGSQNSFLSAGVKPRERYCPSCDSIVYSRRHRSCGVCGLPLPDDCLFTAAEAEKVEMLLRTEQQHHRAWLKRESAM